VVLLLEVLKDIFWIKEHILANYDAGGDIDAGAMKP